MRSAFALLAALALAVPLTAAAAEFKSYALVNEDGTLQIRNRTVRLFGIYVPETDRICQTTIQPPTCGTRAAIALNFKIQGFVSCRTVRENTDGSLDATCFIGGSPFAQGEDLGAYLVEEGLAVATPEAPFAYHALEKIARSNGRGVWGFQVDSIRRQPR